MAQFLKGVFGGKKTDPAPGPGAEDADFADFAGAPEPEPASITPLLPSDSVPGRAAPTGRPTVPYTKWYRVWERHGLADFTQELYIIPFIVLIVVVHLWGTRKNKRRANAWIKAHAPVLQQEFAVVGYGGRRAPNADEVSSGGLVNAIKSDELVIPEKLMREKTAYEYTAYATGRQNVAFVDVKLSLLKRYNPAVRAGEVLMGFVFDSLPAPEERMEATLYPFDGREAQVVENYDESKKSKSTYDGFVFAVVHKDLMKRLRDDRYDLSLTVTKDHQKMPEWLTVFSESAEITDTILTSDFIKALEKAGHDFEALVVSDQPMDQPKKVSDLEPKKRINLSYKLAPNADGYDNMLPVFQHFLRMGDHLVSSAHFRPEALRRVKQTREEEVRKIRKVDDTEKAEERKLEGDKKKKEKREQLLKSMSAEEQKKYLEKEREKDMRKGQKKMSVRG